MMSLQARRALVARTGLCTQTVANLLYGETRYPRHHTIRVLVTALGWKLLARRDYAS